MKKFGKYEKRPAEPVAKKEKEQEQNPLLQTYFSSLLSLVLCVTMFLGTSYAWFSSEVQNTGNEIYVGILKVDLEKQTGEDAWESLSAVTTDNKSVTKLYDGNARWEPGYTSLETIRVVDKGDLAFTYTLGFTDGTIANTLDANYYNSEEARQTALEEAAQWFDIWVFDHQQKKTYTKPESYAAIREEDSGWEHVGTLEEVLAGKAVLNGTMKASNKARSETLAEEENTHRYTIALHMRGEGVATEEDKAALNALMGKKLSLNVKLVATQTSSEQDGVGIYYDQVVTNAEQLAEAFKNGGVIGLAADIEAENISTLAAVPGDKAVELYLNGHTIHVQLKEGTNSSEIFYVTQGGKLTIYGDETSLVHAKAVDSQKTCALINNCGGTVVINGGEYTMEYELDYKKQLIPTLVDNNSTLGESTVIINGGTFRHTRNMFRNFANNTQAKAAIIINGGTFWGDADDFGTIWNQKPSTSIPANAGVVELNGGEYQFMTVCTGFVDENNVTIGDGVKTISLGEWKPNSSNSEWTATINYVAPAENEG